MDSKSGSGQPPTDLATISTILRQKRKNRSQKACQPCHLRKVKCDHQTPCTRCVDRDHPELCSYDLPSKRHIWEGPSPQSRASSSLHLDDQSDGDEDTPLSAKETMAEMRAMIKSLGDSVALLRSELRTTLQATRSLATDPLGRKKDDDDQNITAIAEYDVHGMPTSTVLTGEQVYVGGNSVPAMFMALSREDREGNDAVKELLGKSVLPIFGLDNESATYPFVDLWGIPHGSSRRLELLCSVVPTDAECHQIFRHYHDIAHIIFPVVGDTFQFEASLTEFLNARRQGQPIQRTDQAFGKDIHWLGLLFAILASGLQCYNLPRKERVAKSQVYVCCAYECLRIVNYLSHSTLVDVQTLLILGNVLSNNMNAGVAWSLLGLTTRIAQSLGLHYDMPSKPTALDIAKTNVWSQIIWQDSLLSITFDRFSSPMTNLHNGESSDARPLSYVSAMRRLCRIGLEIVQERLTARKYHHHLHFLDELRRRINDIVASSSEALTSASNCRSLKDQLEYWNFYLHRSYILSELCRPTIAHRKDDSSLGPEQLVLAKSLRATCVESLTNTVEAFLGLQNLTTFATQSWAAVHRSLSSALLLGLLGEPRRSRRVRILLSNLLSKMHDAYSEIDPSEQSGPITRSLTALQKFLPLQTEGIASSSMSDTASTPDLDRAENYRTPGPISSGGSANSLLGTSYQHSSSEGASPLAMLNSILWGGGGGPASPGFISFS